MPPVASRIVVSGSSIQFELRPYRSLDSRGARRFLISVCIVAFAGASLAALNGAWPALVFAGVEVAAVAFALRVNMRAREDLHQIVIDEHNVVVRITERRRTVVLTLPRYWARVRLLPRPCLFHPGTLQLECHGKTCELGSFLSEADRRTVERVLQPMIGPCGCAPSLQSALRMFSHLALPPPFSQEAP